MPRLWHADVVMLGTRRTISDVCVCVTSSSPLRAYALRVCDAPVSRRGDVCCTVAQWPGSPAIPRYLEVSTLHRGQRECGPALRWRCSWCVSGVI